MRANPSSMGAPTAYFLGAILVFTALATFPQGKECPMTQAFACSGYGACP